MATTAEEDVDVPGKSTTDYNDPKDTPRIVRKTTQKNDNDVTFKTLGVVDVLCEECEKLQWKRPTNIQREVIPVALQGRDIIALAETGSGKTGAFALPILQALLATPHKLFAVVLTPTRELAIQIAEQFQALGSVIDLQVTVIVGGVNMVVQALQLAKKPHIIIATPGRLADHLDTTRGFDLRFLKYLVMDEADRILNMDFEKDVNRILEAIPTKRRTLLFSATMTKKVEKLERACLVDPVKIEVSNKYQTVEQLQQYYMFIPLRFKDVYLTHIINEFAGNSFMIFCGTCLNTHRIAFMLRYLGFTTIPLHGQMLQHNRVAALKQFRSNKHTILIATDVASRGLDIAHVDVVINYDMPTRSKDYIHRVGRTARAGRSGVAITLVTQYDIELYQRVEHLIGKKLPLFKTEEGEVMVRLERVIEAQRLATAEVKEKRLGSIKRKGLGYDEEEIQKELNKGKRREEKGKFKHKFPQRKNKKF